MFLERQRLLTFENRVPIRRVAISTARYLLDTVLPIAAVLVSFYFMLHLMIVAGRNETQHANLISSVTLFGCVIDMSSRFEGTRDLAQFNSGH